jgi:hypothetical protein
LKETRIQRGKENKLPPSWVSRLHSQWLHWNEVYSRDFTYNMLGSMIEQLDKKPDLYTFHALLKPYRMADSTFFTILKRFENDWQIMNQIKYIKNELENRLAHGWLTWQTSSAFTMFLLKCKYWYIDKSQDKANWLTVNINNSINWDKKPSNKLWSNEFIDIDIED